METYYKCLVCWNEFDYVDVGADLKPTSTPEECAAEMIQLEACPYCGSRENLKMLLTNRTSILQAITQFFGSPPKFFEEENKHSIQKVFSEQIQLTFKLFTPIGPEGDDIHIDELALERKDQDEYKPMSRLTKVGKIVYLDLVQDSNENVSYLVFKIEKQSWETVMVLRLELHPDGSFFVHFE
jgi:DNA-directed RNA polymerase subunit RPC12/RpoP